MKLFIQLFSLSVILFLSACGDGEVGPRGPQGPPGQDGADGNGLLGTVFEYEVDFTGPEYEAFVDFPDDFMVYDSDKVLVYLLWDVTEDGKDIWRLLPQTILTDNGIYQYNFDFTTADVRLFMESEFPIDLLTSADTDNQIFRVLVVPADFYEKARIDYSDYDAMASTLGLPDVKGDRNGFMPHTK